MDKKMILLVEDNPSHEALFLRACRKIKIINEIKVVRDGAEALDFLFAWGDFVDRDPDMLPGVILLDLKLPKINGLEVLSQVRGDERTRFLPVVVLTTSNEAKDMIASYESGANSYIRKPVDFNQFIEIIRQLSTYWLELNEFPPHGSRLDV